MTRWKIKQGDALEVLRNVPDNRFDAMITDPPAGIGFMGKKWDGSRGGMRLWVKWLASIMTEALRASKPGVHALVWALPRTSHWTGLALERAGWEVRDVVTHLFGTGFPKSLNLGDGIGTALKPAAEFWFLARKPVEGTIRANAEKWGTGGLRIDDCRIPTDDSINTPQSDPTKRQGTVGKHMGLSASSIDRMNQAQRESIARMMKLGRWPANLILSGEGILGDEARYFYQPKPSRKERDEGLDGLPQRSAGDVTGREDGSDGLNSPRAGAGRTSGAKNVHPTVKSIALMRYLVRLITPKGGLVLDPFMGSGSTGIAALLEGCRFRGIEQSPEYIEIARRRIEHWSAKK